MPTEEEPALGVPDTNRPDASDDGGGDMDVHRPKPWHGWRELLKEVGTIVIGILIALGLEQAIEAIHEQKIADEARDAVRAEVRENLWWIDRRQSREECARQRMDQIGDLLDRARHGRAYAAAQDIGATYHSKITSLRWEANAQAGRTSLFTPQEQRYLGNMYYTTEQFSRLQEEEENAWAELSAIDRLDHLTPSEIDEFGMLLAQARYESTIMALDALRAHQWADLMHLTADNPNQFEVPSGRVAAAPCPPITAPSMTERSRS